MEINYDVTGNPGNEEILNSEAGIGSLTLQRSILIHINHSKLLQI